MNNLETKFIVDVKKHVRPRDKRWSVVVRLALPSSCSVDSVLFWSKKFNSLTFTNLIISLHRTLVNAIGR